MAMPATFSAFGPPDIVANVIADDARNARANAAAMIAQCDGGALNLNEILTVFLRNLSIWRTRWPQTTAVAGVLAQIQARFPAKNVTQATLDAVPPAIQTMIVFIEANFPVEAVTNRPLHLIMARDGTGNVTPRTITAGASLTAFRAALVTFRDAFDGSA